METRCSVETHPSSGETYIVEREDGRAVRVVGPLHHSEAAAATADPADALNSIDPGDGSSEVDALNWPA